MDIPESVKPEDMPEAIRLINQANLIFPKTFALGYRLYKQAAGLGHPQGVYMVGKCLMYGHGVTPNFPLAERFLKQAIQLGHRRALLMLAILYRWQNNTAASNGYYLQAAHAGDSDAQFALARAYDFGDNGLPQNAAKAIEWYRVFLITPESRHYDALKAIKRLNPAIWQEVTAQRAHNRQLQAA